MRERIRNMVDFFVIQKAQRAYRQPEEDAYRLAREFVAAQMPAMERSAMRLRNVLDREEPVVFPDERIAFTRTVQTIPDRKSVV